jgi:hypothetical protein
VPFGPRGREDLPAHAGPDLRALAASSGAKDAEVWTFCLVNRSDKPKTVRVRVPDAKPGTFKHYLYSRDKAAADKDGFPVPVEETPGDLGAGIEVVCPGNAVYFLTSVEP